MNFASTKKLAAAVVLLSFLAIPAVAAPSRQPSGPDEPAIVRLIKAAKRFFGIAPAESYPTIPKP